MDKAERQIRELQIRKTMENLRKNRMEAFYVPTAAEVPEQVASLLNVGDTVAVGGSMTLEQAGVMDLLRSGKYRFLDRYAPGLTPEQVRQVFLDSFSADAYLCSANAVTMNGELYNVDGNSNRVAAICYGPRSVIIVAGCNKLVPDLKAAFQRVKLTAAPANAARLGCATYCASAGVCQGLDEEAPTAGCGTQARICCNYVVSACQREAGRIKVILVGEPLGY
ncbi:MAG TPA: lactate utilization protein [Firmicutes bacterium]|nr:lactate utilization protein [Bacillota bacterium]